MSQDQGSRDQEGRNGADPASRSDATSRLDAALARLDAAASAIESAVEDGAAMPEPGSELMALLEDRRRLAGKLDVETARARTLAEANSEVSRRVVGVMETIRDVVDGGQSRH